MGILAKTFGGLFLLGAAGAVVNPPGPYVPAPDHLANVKLASFAWSKGGFDNVAVLERATVTNAGAVALRDIEITCRLYAPSGTLISVVSGTIYERLPAGKSRTFGRLPMGFMHSQASRASCSVTGVRA